MPDSSTANTTTTRVATDDPDVSRRIRDTLVRYCSVRALWILGIAVVVGDLVTTVYGLDIGLREQNPVVASVLVDHGVAGLVALKLFALGWVVGIWRLFDRRYGIAAMTGLMIPQGIAVALNVVTILSA